MGFILENIRYKNILEIDRLTLPDQRMTCIVGESGGGKTTLLRLLNNMITPDAGQVLYNGTSLEEMDPVALRRKVLMLPQSPTVFPGSIQDNLLAGLKFSGLPAAAEPGQVQALDRVKLEKSLDTDASTLSGGEKQRLALARILLMQPEALLLDEPSSALDEETEKQVIKGVVEFARERRITVIMVTHTRAVAKAFGEIIVTVGNGRVAEVKEVSRA